ncbi:MAG: glycosyltransferase family 4 protein [Candidatus Omnitrophota bacterium]
MKVCFISPRTYPLFHSEVQEVFGGAEVQFYLVGCEITKDSNFEISFLVGDYGQSEIESYNNIRLIKALHFKKNIFAKIYYFYKAFNKANADTYIQTTLTPFSGIIALCCRVKRKRLIYRVAHDNETDGGYAKIYGNIRYFFGRIVFLLADAIIVQNEYQRTSLKKNMNINGNLIRNGYILSEIPLGQKEYILWVGRSEPFKRPKLFLKLARENPDKHFVMLCQPIDNPELDNEIANEAKDIPNLKFVSFIPFHKVDDYYQRAMLFVNTSSQEGFPNTFLHACAATTPILSLKVNPDSFLNNYKCGLCADDDWAQFVDMFERLCDPNLTEEYGLNARKYLECEHDVRICVRQYKKLFYTNKCDLYARR